uniref:Carboxylesterase type B domain-containing protein n=1 Tax=Kwoniella bestiolae CBS 10118 TaxID=1296100 RepID=A0A1B9FX41_9TREE|nr:hypothetical protein I302_07700 [Kwoniella bestiolae CBS 10118]OCF23346.1 hypothetical protein I302_07700 [Kwoniella bestiolae CBS 10118]
MSARHDRMLLTSISTLLLSLVAASPLRRESQVTQSRLAPSPVATICPESASERRVTIKGIVRAGEDFDSYLGIPYDQAPFGDLRWAPSQPFNYGQTGSINGTDYRSACIQLSLFGADSPIPDNAGAAGTSEDCLFVNVFTPRGASSSNEKLPVWLWRRLPVSYTPGSTGTTYRLRNFQLPPGWVWVCIWTTICQIRFRKLRSIRCHDGIAMGIGKYWGFWWRSKTRQSAGGFQVSLQYLQPEQDLFQYGIIQSGAPSISTLGPIASVKPQAWDRFFELLNCSDSAQDQVQCARQCNSNVVVNAYAQLFKEFNRGDLIGQTIDGVILAASPYSLLGQGRYARRPFIIGDVRDEGTVFATATNESSFVSAVRGSGLATRSNETIHKLLELYPDEPSVGSPFDTGTSLFNKTSTYKRASAYSGDAMFQAARRNWLDVTYAQGPTQSCNYEYARVASNIGSKPAQGVFHGAELNFTRGRPTENQPWWNEEDVNLSKALLEYCLRFIYQGNPNQEVDGKPILGSSNITTDAFIAWPTYGGPAERNTILLEGKGRSVVKDDFRSEQLDFINSINTEYSA